MKYALATATTTDDLAEHVPGTPDRYKHGWIPLVGGVPSPAVMPKTEKPGTEPASIAKLTAAFQLASQEKATRWFDSVSPDHLEWTDASDDVSRRALSFWDAYQEPAQYGQMNQILRGPSNTTRKELISNVVNDLFAKIGTKTPKDARFYRALRGDTPDADKFLDSLKPGSVYTERGMISTSANLNMTQGWLKVDNDNNYNATRDIDPQDTVIEIRPPAGTVVVGGHTGFIETMMHPDTKFKVISSDIVSTAKAKSPIDPDSDIDQFKYRHVVVEVIP